MTLGQRIQQLRLAHNLSQEALGERLGTTRQTVSRWELDQALPELAKLVTLCRLFAVSTDSLLVDGITTFDPPTVEYPCGVWRGNDREIVETERFALELSCSHGGTCLQACLWRGFEAKKTLLGICTYDAETGVTSFAVDGENGSLLTNAPALAERLRTPYDPDAKQALHRTERFAVDHTGRSLPTVRAAGIRTCLTQWRCASVLQQDAQGCSFTLSTPQTDYVFSVRTSPENVYCGAGRAAAFDLGLFSGQQYFRIRHYKDDREAFCRSGCDFSRTPSLPDVPTQSCSAGGAVQTPEGNLFCVKRYTDDEIVLQGCGDDEYVYRRTDPRNECFTDPE